MPAVAISAYTATSALGRGLEAQLSALQQQRSGLQPAGCIEGIYAPGWVGRVDAVESVELPPALLDYSCRNNQLAWLSLQQDGFLAAAQDSVRRYGAQRVAVFMGTSTSGIAETERAYRQQAAKDWPCMPEGYSYRHSHNVHSLGDFVARAVGAKGPQYTISTACSSSAKVFASAARAMRAGLCDAAIVGGVDSLCFTTLFGFHALQLVAPQPCRPADAQRQGISIGEAGAYCLLERNQDSAYALLGYGESSDAHHMSTPDPAGRGASVAMQAALSRAGLSVAEVDYINLHGTGTRSNDAAEDAAVFSVFAEQVPCSSSKGWSGHCLGAAGALEAVYSLLALSSQTVWGSLNTQTRDPELKAGIVMSNQPANLRHVMSNSFGFGGTNCSLLFGAQL
ncbi:MAG: beta-ketoacyl-[acyl-carrier-protein] synthase family protein [Oceanococcus sp.]